MLLLGAATVAFLLPMFAVPGGLTSGDPFRDNDWLNCRSFDLMSRQAMLEHGQLPLRSHLVGGGFPIIAHPSDGSWAPTILAVLLFGDVLGVKLNLVLLFLAGTFGVFGLARRWLGLGRPASLVAALSFGFSAWAPSMLLTGFYHQAFFLLIPPVLLCLLRGKGRPDRLLWAAMFLFLVLQQGGHAFAAAVYFLGVVIWLCAVGESPGERAGNLLSSWARLGSPVAAGLLLCSSLGVARGLRLQPHGWGGFSLLIPTLAVALVAVWTWRSPRMRAFWRCLLPWAGRLMGVLGVAVALGAARVVGLAYLRHAGRYSGGIPHMRGWLFAEAPAEDAWIERFYEGPLDFLTALWDRAPQVLSYGEFHGRAGGNIEYEYAYLGLTAVPLVLAALGLLLRRRRPEVIVLGVCAATFALICAGWFVPPDFHLLLVWGFPWAGDLAQPIKYFNFFILLPLALLAGVGVEGLGGLRLLAGRRPGRRPLGAWLAWGLVALMLLPFLQNRGILGELFARPGEAPAREQFHQVALIASPSLVSASRQAIHAHNEAARLRDYRRPRQATEYHNISRGVGTVDWYGTVMSKEYAVPDCYYTPEGKALSNPRYRGEAWLEQHRGRILAMSLTPNVIQVKVHLDAPDAVVINQNYLAGFSTNVGVLGRRSGLLRVTLDSRGEHNIRLTYQPPHFIAGLALSGLALMAWLAAQLLLWRKRKQHRPKDNNKTAPSPCCGAP